MSPKKDAGFTGEERAAMKERARELKAEARMDKDRAEGESAVLAKIAELSEPDRAMAERLHEIIKASAPALSPKTWYGMPAYAKDGKVICFFQSGQKFNTRYATLGFSSHLPARLRSWKPKSAKKTHESRSCVFERVLLKSMSQEAPPGLAKGVRLRVGPQNSPRSLQQGPRC